MADLSFAYANARVKAAKSKLFDRDRMRDLAEVGSLTQFIELLEESEYKPSFVSESTRHSGLELVKAALDDDLARKLEKVEAIVPDGAKPALHAILRQWEVNNIKKVLAAKALGKPVSTGDLLPVGGGSKSLCQKLVGAQTLKEAVSTVQAAYRGHPGVCKAASEFSRTQDVRPLLSALDEAYYRSLAKLARGQRDPFTRKFLLYRIDFANAMMILRMRRTGVPHERIRHHLVTGASRAVIAEMLGAKTQRAALQAFARLRHVQFSETAYAALDGNGPLSQIEVEFEKAFLSDARSTASVSVLSLGAVVAYLHLKQEEVHSLRKIAYATQFDVRDDVKKTVLAAY
ncbi:V-type ATPase subunit [Candidatus Micrarchaeota archaeon]|nr:V-type ATPase subunit [Candidatus Micrarchaeota archaeon]